LSVISCICHTWISGGLEAYVLFGKIHKLDSRMSDKDKNFLNFFTFMWIAPYILLKNSLQAYFMRLEPLKKEKFSKNM